MTDTAGLAVLDVPNPGNGSHVSSRSGVSYASRTIASPHPAAAYDSHVTG